MASRIIINAKEITHPLLKFLLLLISLLIAIGITAVILLFVLPLIGLTIAATTILAAFIGVVILAAVFYFGIGAALLGLIFRQSKKP